ncbi:hypothetical protein DZ860_00280 [Vibrio sinensis]|uniref:PelD GGDEF domain-containing protein n=1 Tax=Vibrio sinensis TaxID=2302434 RepID=A0A3A6REQ5_9VIBR|nr:PelD GGDEF domain-containing protein [Vibrio sinensis]RJX75161.1 hypothetical protein DZ860_00280 [Vibrio sinensis]
MRLSNHRTKIVGHQRPYFAWLETGGMTLITLFIWAQSDLINPSIIESGKATVTSFFWPILGPLLIALRYGLHKGMTCALIASIGIAAMMHLAGDSAFFPLSHAIGTIILTMIAGEFHHHWHNVNRRHALDQESMNSKLESFTKHYHLLKVSHDQLEQRNAGQTYSLRTSIQALRQIATQYAEHRLIYLAHPMLNLLAEVGGLEVAGVYQVEKGRVESKAAAVLGDHHQLEKNDPMLKEALESQKLLSAATLTEKQEHKSRYQLCIPLVNTHGVTQAIVVAESAKFFMLIPANIALLSLIANHSADLLSDEVVASTLQHNQKSYFTSYLQRAKYNHQHYGANSSIIICIDRNNQYPFALNSMSKYRRGADIYWSCKTNSGQSALVVLLPLTTPENAQQYSKRLREQIHTEVPTEHNDFDMHGPLSIATDWAQIQDQMAQLGTYDENLADHSDGNITKLKRIFSV